MNTIIKRNILEVKAGIICQQVNCKGVMGSGLAEQIRSSFPQVYTDYIKAFAEGKLILGNMVLTTIDEIAPLYIANLCGQDRYGRGGVFTDYDALEVGFKKVFNLCEYDLKIRGIRLNVFIPYKIGCGLAGGNWSTVLEIIGRILPKAIICRWRG